MTRTCLTCGGQLQRKETEAHARFARRKFCSPACYQAADRHTPPAPRFWSKVLKGEGDACWIWTGARRAPYGQLKAGNRLIKTHRFSWQLHYGAIPDGMHILHKCDTPLCVRPDHLFLGTHADNMHDFASKGRHWLSKRTHCARGHEFTPENTVVRRNGSRGCRQCRRENGDKARATRTAAAATLTHYQRELRAPRRTIERST